MDNYLAHHGVKGMKWGIRKEKNYTRDRYKTTIGKGGITRTKIASKGDPVPKDVARKMHGRGVKTTYKIERKADSKKIDKRSNWSDDAKTAYNIKQKSVNQMSNAELKKLNERTRLEQEYKKLNPSTVSKGWKYVGVAAAGLGTVAGLYNNSNTLIKAGKTIVKAAAR